jgi:hypothetical protein
MPAFSRRLLIASTVTLLVALLAGVVVLVLPILPFQHQRARERWEQQQMRHYEVEVLWANGMNFGHAQVEIRDNKLVKGIDLDTGQPIAPPKTLSAAYFGSIDNLFAIVDLRIRPQWNWRNLLARYYPDLARKIDSCPAPLSDIYYDAQFGFPSDLWFNDSWCAKTFFNYSHVKIIKFTPLS